MFNFLRFFILFFAFTGAAYADFYYWTGPKNANNPTGRYSSPSAVCASLTYAPYKIKLSMVNSTHGRCVVDSSDHMNGYLLENTYRQGDSCPPNSEYNDDTGECEPRPDQCEAGNTYSSSFPATRFGNFYVPNAPASACINSCAYDQYSGGGGGCFPTASGTYCVANFLSNGEECGGNTDFPDEPPQTDPDPDDKNDYENCVRRMQADGSYMWDCNPAPEQGNCPDGFLIGADGNTCYRDPNVPPPKDPTLPDNGGGDGGDGGDGGYPPDYSKDTTLKSIDGKIGETNKLLGELKDAVGNIPGGGSGGTTPGTGDGEGGEGGTGEGVENCDSGRCDFGDERGDPFGGEVRSFADSLSAAMDGMKNSPLGSSISNIQFPSGGTCPVGSTSINIGFGSMAIDFESHCSLWDQIAPILSAVFLALWAIIAVRVFLSA